MRSVGSFPGPFRVRLAKIAAASSAIYTSHGREILRHQRFLEEGEKYSGTEDSFKEVGT